MSDIFLVLQNQLVIMRLLERIVGKDPDLSLRIKLTQKRIKQQPPVRDFDEVPM